MQLVYYRHNHRGAPSAVPKGPISFYELTIVLKGALVYRINGQEQTVAEGEGIFLTPGMQRERADCADSVNYVSFNFLTDAPPDLPLKIPQIVNNDCKLLIACADEIRQKYYADADEQLVPLLECLLLNVRSNLENTKEHPLITQVKRYVNEHLSEKITLQQIGEETYFSPLYCEAVFKQKTGISIIRYVIQRRVEEAQKLLLEGTLSLKKIAETVGFEDYNYFARTFKKATGRTPREYKNSFAVSANELS